MSIVVLKKSTTIDWATIASYLAVAGDDEQAVFFKTFVKECQSWGTHYEVEKQLTSVRMLLTDEEREVLSAVVTVEDVG